MKKKKRNQYLYWLKFLPKSSVQKLKWMHSSSKNAWNVHNSKYSKYILCHQQAKNYIQLQSGSLSVCACVFCRFNVHFSGTPFPSEPWSDIMLVHTSSINDEMMWKKKPKKTNKKKTPWWLQALKLDYIQHEILKHFVLHVLFQCRACRHVWEYVSCSSKSWIRLHLGICEI